MAILLSALRHYGQHKSGCLIVLLMMLTGCSGKVPLPENFVLPPPRPEIPLSAPDEIEAFSLEAPDTNVYRLGPGDEITLEVWGYAELSGKHVIGPDGYISLPLIGATPVAGLTREELGKHITDLLQNYYQHVSVVVRIENYISNHLMVLGRVKKPGEIRFSGPTPTLLEAIALAGGLDKSDGLNQYDALTMTRCTIFRGQSQVIQVSLAPLMNGQDMSANLRLMNNDLVYIPELEEKLVYVLGQVKNPGAFRLHPRMTYLEVLSLAGGTTVDAASSDIRVIRPGADINQPIALSDLISPQQDLNVALQEGDILYVPTSLTAELNYAVRFLTPFSTILNIYSDIESIRSDAETRRLNEEQIRLQKERDALKAERDSLAGFE